MLGITFELSGKKTTGGQPFAIFDTATLSLHEKSRLSEIVRAALGAVPNDLDLAELLGKAVLVTVVHRESKGKVWANVGTVTATPEGLPTPDTETPLLMFDLESPDPTVFGKLPALYRKLIENRVQPPSPLGAGEDTSLDDDIPF